MNYIGEHLLPGELGRIATYIAFASALAGAYSFFRVQQSGRGDLFSLGRWAFRIHGLSVFTLVGLLFYLLFRHYFEYDYVWKHSSLDLPLRYIFSAFWEGQEGSFILWTIWHVVLGWVLMRSAKDWEAPVMAVVCLVQVFLISMVLGIQPFGLRIGSSPFVLIRELPENVGLPWTQLTDYLERIPAFMDGEGLNPLLQNYWMTIHPPVTFLGFASTLIPFAFALAGLWTRRYNEWLKPALPWAFFSVMILGTGILMGGAWAYEALSFGGFWAWDPVENSSLVAWLVVVGAAHLLLIHKNKGSTLKSSFLLSILGFLLILYSTFLTRSGILGDSSVHAFVDLGLNGQLLIYLLFFAVLSLGMLLWHYRRLPRNAQQDEIWSREFWMFIGSLTLLASAFQIAFTTSIPVWNSLFGPEGWLHWMGSDLAPPLDVVQHYNSFQVPFALVISLLMASGQFLRYKKTDRAKFFRQLSGSLVLTVLLGGVLIYVFSFHEQPILAALLLTSLFSIIANSEYAIRVLKGKVRKTGASIAHVGFGLVLLGALISNGKKEVISENQRFIAKDFPQNENILMDLGDTLRMGDYLVTWTGERREGNYRYYDVDYLQWVDGVLTKQFQLAPSILMNERMGNSPEPSTQHSLLRDVYTHVTYAPIEDPVIDSDGYTSEARAELELKESAFLDESMILLDSIETHADVGEDGKILAELRAHLVVAHIDGNTYFPKPGFRLEGEEISYMDTIIEEAGLKFRFEKILEEEHFEIKGWRRAEDEKPFIVMKAILFPMINLLWIGSVLIAVGSILAVVERIRMSRS
jgi:cytochrome c-type biogenesis protein CcmF